MPINFLQELLGSPQELITQLSLYLTVLLRARIRTLITPWCPTCGASAGLVKYGSQSRKGIGRVQLFRCNLCGRHFCERANWPWYRSRVPEGLSLLLAWLKLEGVPLWKLRKWFVISSYQTCYRQLCRLFRALALGGKQTSYRLPPSPPAAAATAAPAPPAAAAAAFILQIDELWLKCRHSWSYLFTFVPRIIKRRQRNGEPQQPQQQQQQQPQQQPPPQPSHYCWSVLLEGLSSLETKAAVKAALQKFGGKPDRIDTDGMTSYPAVIQELGIPHGVVIHDKEWVSAEGYHVNGCETLHSILRPWLAASRGLPAQLATWSQSFCAYRNCRSLTGLLLRLTKGMRTSSPQ